ncbi:ACR228Cp [Eremothecium gossypii ATCC 10895]|uniref:Kinesin-like protein KIP1 n=1 Tax=Eremothecium gossypii (strain ATCC 10895 / CBS 109.51 / FGSC 9923 / NRRL Y-1056) TaxID=284811 RepID=KIP1_EREGS|nr:ACR228Cp [Eremothecium gossypii ATCC 10895]Q8J1G4.1 RecName: Full=Kinesin-like protein KIP1 [Eremothecium gossypii ATCC 10895]AAN87137.1 KIP1 [Eremothecium gossypii]AAS51454.1 ACR228Cp [Eremothecium gossypii ATCC 10895]AEY95745.1 FACR228Cp [Eremothecium gossypii FDAG1]
MLEQAEKLMKRNSSGAMSAPQSKPLARSRSSTMPTTTQKRVRSSQQSEGEPEYNIKVYVRCRSRNEREIREKSSVVISTLGNNGREVILTNPGTGSNKTYTFDRVFGVESDQESMFNQVARAYINEMIEGYNCTVFAYGQTGTGKTYTMSGDITMMGSSEDDPNFVLLSEHAGIIPRVLVELFRELREVSEDYSVKVSFLELYNEKLRDLLVDDKDVSLEDHNFNGMAPPESIRIYDSLKTDRTSPNGYSIFVKGMEEMYIRSAQEGLKLLMDGSLKRKVAATKCNDLSSRSHTIFTITTNVTKIHPISGEQYVKVGKLNLVDLAGSENINRSGAENKRAQEAGLINKSLLTLGRVINALVDHSQHIPYRESKLTRLLQDSLGGKTKTCIIATISPAKISMEETVSTLEYATRAKSIKNTPQVNQLMAKESCIIEYIQEIERLRKELRASHSKEGIYITQEKFETYESNSILVEEQQAKIDNLQEQLRRLKEKFLEQTKLIKEKDGQIKELDVANRKYLEQSKDLTIYINGIHSKLEDYEHTMIGIHNNNMKLLEDINDNRGNIHEDLLAKVDHIETCNLIISREITSLISIRNVLQAYSDRFKTVLGGVFEELQEKLTQVGRTTEESQLDVDLSFVDEKFEEVTDIIKATCENLVRTMDEHVSNMKLETTDLTSSCASLLEKECQALHGKLQKYVESMKQELNSTLQEMVRDLDMKASSMLNVVQCTKDGLISHKKELEADLESQKREHFDIAQTMEEQLQKIVGKERQNIQESMKASYDFLMKQMVETELRQKNFEESIVSKVKGLLSHSNNGMSKMSSYAVGRLYDSAIGGVNSIENTVSSATFSMKNDLQEFQMDISPICDSRRFGDEFTAVETRISEAIREELTPKLQDITSKACNLIGLGVQDINQKALGVSDDQRRELRSVINNTNNHADRLRSEIGTLVNYVSQEHRDNIMQISQTQDEILQEQIASIGRTFDVLGNINKPDANVRTSVPIEHELNSAINELPPLYMPQRPLSLCSHGRQLLDEAYSGNENLSPSTGKFSNFPTPCGDMSAQTPTTPMPVPDQPLTKMPVPQTISSLRSLRRLTMDICEHSADMTLGSIHESQKAMDSSRRYTLEPRLFEK